MPDDARLAAVAGLLVQVDADVVEAFARLPRWDCSAALLRGELGGLLRVFRAVAGLPNAVSDDDVLARARALAARTRTGATA